MARNLPFRKYLIGGAFALSATGAMVAGMLVSASPARAQWTVFDPSNYSQNLLTAARTLTQIDNQVRMLQNQAQGLVNQAKNLTTLNFPELQQLQRAIQHIDQLMGQAQGVQFRVANLNRQFEAAFPTSFNSALSNDQHVVDARHRLDLSMAAYKQTMTVQAQVVENIAADEAALGAIVQRSQGAEGALQASQASNQLLALVAKQQFQIEHLMAAQYRADAIDRANRDQVQSDAHGAAARFLGSGNAYTPQ